MIAVIADDITGAAEMAGVALRYGMKVLVTADAGIKQIVDVLIVYTNTRSMKKDEAATVMARLTKKLSSLSPGLFYKKTDSVLRGHVLAEMKAQMIALNLEKGLLVPVNPSLGRIIKGGRYYVNDQPIDQTSFAHDPEFPVKTADVLQMLDGGNTAVQVISKNSHLPGCGICVGEAEADEDVAGWAAYDDGTVLLAGGASFFNALLARKYKPKNTTRQGQLSPPLVLISGTTFQKNVERVRNLLPFVSYMPENVLKTAYPTAAQYHGWLEDVRSILSECNKVIIAVDNTMIGSAGARRLRQKKAQISRLILETAPVKELLIEGGSTAYAVIQRMGWKTFAPTEELQQGIVRMQVKGVEDLHLTIKPGSYEWPQVWVSLFRCGDGVSA